MYGLSSLFGFASKPAEVLSTTNSPKPNSTAGSAIQTIHSVPLSAKPKFDPNLIDSQCVGRPIQENPEANLSITDLKPGDIISIHFYPSGMSKWFSFPEAAYYIPESIRNGMISGVINMIGSISHLQNQALGVGSEETKYHHSSIVLGVVTDPISGVNYVAIADSVYPAARVELFTESEIKAAAKTFDVYRHPDDQIARQIAKTSNQWAQGKHPPQYPSLGEYFSKGIVPFIEKSLPTGLAKQIFSYPEGFYEQFKNSDSPTDGAKEVPMICSDFVAGVLKSLGKPNVYSKEFNPYTTLPYALPAQLRKGAFARVGHV